MADKKLRTYECFLTFSFQSKYDDFMSPDLKFDHISLLLDSSQGGLITLSGNVKSKHPFILADAKDVYFHCSSGRSDIGAKDFLNSILCREGFEALGDCVFDFQPVIGPHFFLGVKDKEFLNEQKKKTRLQSQQKELSRRSRNKTS